MKKINNLDVEQINKDLNKLREQLNVMLGAYVKATVVYERMRSSLTMDPTDIPF